jgi:hypothetical protein
MVINRVFDRLDDWRQLPSYQLERRADIFFSVYLEDVFSQIKNEKVVCIIPELPIKKGTIEPNRPRRRPNESYKVDYAVFTESNQVYLVELKTDNQSITKNQCSRYRKVIEVGFKAIMQDVIKLFHASKSRGKYEYLLSKLEQVGAVAKKEGEWVCTDKFSFYHTPLFIKPTKQATDEGEVLDFDALLAVVSDMEDPLTKRFKTSLLRWKRQV